MTTPVPNVPQILIVIYAAGFTACYAYLTFALALERHRNPRAYQRHGATLARLGSSYAQRVALTAIAWPLFVAALAGDEYDQPSPSTYAGAERARARKAHR